MSIDYLVILYFFCIFATKTMSKHSIVITDDNLFYNITEYCRLNELKIGQFVTDMLKKQFAIEQYGDVPFTVYKKQKTEEKQIEVKNIEFEPVVNTIINGPISEIYAKTEAPKEFYQEIKTSKKEEIKPKQKIRRL